MKTYNSLTEKNLLQNMTKVLLLLLIFIWGVFLIQQLLAYTSCFSVNNHNLISLSKTLSFSGLIIAFWYGFKKYERDKELEIIEKYTEKYNKIREKLHLNSQEILFNKSKNLMIISKNYDELLDLYYIEYYLAYKGYIDKELWSEWDYWITLDIEGSVLACQQKELILSKTVNYTGNIFIDSFILNFKLYNQNNSHTSVKIDNKTFYEYVSNIIIGLLDKGIIHDPDFIKDVKNKI